MCSRQLRGELTVPPSLPKHELPVPEAAQLTGMWAQHSRLQPPRLLKLSAIVALGPRAAGQVGRLSELAPPRPGGWCFFFSSVAILRLRLVM